MVENFGVSFLPERIKTPIVLYTINRQASKIHAVHEVRHRMMTGPLSPEKLKNLVFNATGDMAAAERAEAQLMLDETRK